MDNIEDKIIKLLENELGKKLPKVGVVAGQSVAEAYFRLNNIPIKTRIKDVDLFYYTLKGLENHCNEEDFREKFFMKIDTEHRFLRRESSYGMVNIVSEGKLLITNVVEKDKLNIVITEKDVEYSKHYRYINHVINSFDLNSVQIGIDLRTKTLIKSEAFDRFVETKQIEVINYCSPVPSIARLVEKSELFPDIYANIDYEVQLVISKMLFFKEKEHYSKHRGMYMSLDRFKSFTEKTQEIIEKYFNLEEKEVMSSQYYYSEVEDYDDDDEDDSPYYRGKTRCHKYFKIIKFSPKKDMIKESTLKKIEDLKNEFDKNRFDYSILKRSFLVNLLKKDFHNIVKERIVGKGKSSKLLLFSYFKEDIFKETKNDLLAINRHYNFALALMKRHSVNEIANFIRKMEKNKTSYVIGMFETGEINDPDIIKKDIKKIIKKMEEDDKKLSEKYNFSVAPEILKETGLVMHQVKNKNHILRLGSEMGHCVGGYWKQVEAGRSIIIDIVKDYKNNERWTLELSLRKARKKSKGNIEAHEEDCYDYGYSLGSLSGESAKNYEYRLSQVYGKHNERAPSEIRKLSEELGKKISKSLTDEWIKKIRKVRY